MALFKGAWKFALLNQPFHAAHPNGSTDHLLTFVSHHTPIRWKRLAHSAKVADSAELAKVEPKSLAARKRLKVAIVGRPNAGKSTLINKILNLNVCDVSVKTHTTRTALKAAYTNGDTQIVFVDTPGLVTKKEFSKFELSNVFNDWKQKVFNDVDIIGIIHEVTSPKEIFKLHLKLVQSIHDVPESKPLFMMLNKIDLVIDKAGLSEAVKKLTRSPEEEGPGPSAPNIWNKFSKVFFISALKNIGVEEIVNFLLEEAKPGEWYFQPTEVCNKPLHRLVADLLRAQVMGILPCEISYKCNFEVEYLEENDLGEMICVALVRCDHERHLKILIERKKSSLRKLAKKLESDLYKIVGRVFRLRVVALAGKPKPRVKNK